MDEKGSVATLFFNDKSRTSYLKVNAAKAIGCSFLISNGYGYEEEDIGIIKWVQDEFLNACGV